MANPNAYITPGANQNITSSVLTNDMQFPADAPTVSLTIFAYHTVVELASLSQNTTINMNTAVLPPFGEGSELTILIPSDLTSPSLTYTVTFGTGFKMPSNTLAITGAKHGMGKFTYFQGFWVGSTTLSAS